MLLENRIAIVTGGAQGIGAATASLLRSEGALVEVWDAAAGHPETGKEEGLTSHRVDVSDSSKVEAALEELVSRLGVPDILINNAGIIADDFASELSVEDWERVLKVNLSGTFIPCKALIPHLRERGSGVITNTSSISALGNRGQANYAASKAGVIGLSRTLSQELAGDGIRVNCVAPGAIETSMFDEVPEKVKEKFLQRIPLGRLGTPDDVARLHLFLASDEASYMTGQTVFCDGGITL
ncbi:MAG: 3-oxoacyl-ACP reductase FabG [Planctomycetota bacterium]|nr:3-oxoacyl-ACP reductase FabG [Planctomycetota bacterium]